MKRIAVLDIAASKTGALSVLRDFAAHISQSGQDNEWIFITGTDYALKENEVAPHLKVRVRSDVKSSRLNRLKFDHLTGCKYLESLRPDLIFSLQNTLPKGIGKGIKTALYVHQPLGYQNCKDFSLFKKEEREMALYQKLIAREIDSSVKRADLVIVQTAWMKEALCRKTGKDGKQVSVITPDVAKLKNYRDFNIPFRKDLFIYPAGPILYKNHGLILEALIELSKRGLDDIKVIFTLREDELPHLSKLLQGEYKGLFQKAIEWRGNIPRQELIKLYQEATLLFPSYIETFGYPPAEARQLGMPILASDMPFTREVLKGYGNVGYFNPFKPEELSDLMESVRYGKLRPIDIDALGAETYTNSYSLIEKELLSLI